MNVNSEEIKKVITNNLIKDFPVLNPIIEPRIKNKVEIQEKEIKVSAPVIHTDIPKVKKKQI